MRTVERFRQAVEARDVAAMTALFAPDIRFFSPVKFRPFEGAELVGQVFRVLMRTFEDFRYVGQFAGQAEEGDGGAEVDSHVLIFRTVVDGKDVHGMDLVQTNADDLISTFTVMIRPQSALTAVSEAIYAGLVTDGAVAPPAPR